MVLDAMLLNIDSALNIDWLGIDPLLLREDSLDPIDIC